MFSVLRIDGHYAVVGENNERGGGFLDGCVAAPSDLEVPHLIDDKKVVEIGAHAFHGCLNIITVSIEEGYNTIGTYAFAGCYNLTYVVIPRSLSILKLGSFEDCFSLQNFTIPQNSNLHTIYGYSFNQCYNLSTFIIQPSVKSIIGSELFSDIKAQFTLFYYPSFDNYDKDIFRATPNVTIYTPPHGANYFGNKSTIHISLPNMCLIQARTCKHSQIPEISMTSMLICLFL